MASDAASDDGVTGGRVLAMGGSSEFLSLIAQKTHFLLILYRLKAHSIGSTAIYW